VNIVRTLNTKPLLNENRVNIVEGSHVRRFFEEDLAKIAPGYCFLPEWICHSMTQVALNSPHKVLFYPVNAPQHSDIPLETNWSYLMNLIAKYRVTNKEIAILMAFPLGYIDHKIHKVFEFLKNTQNVHLFLDLAQSYGAFNFFNLLSQVKALYISFNGQKLIQTGGALRFSTEGDSFSVSSFEEKMERALHIQEEKWLNTYEQVERTLSCNLGTLGPSEASHANTFQNPCTSKNPDALQRRVLQAYVGKNALRAAMERYNKRSLRSSYHRTALTLPSHHVQKLREEGFGQPVHPDPQYSLIQMSDSYLAWQQEIFLLFPARRQLPCV
jgi:hypothetical protein